MAANRTILKRTLSSLLNRNDRSHGIKMSSRLDSKKEMTTESCVVAVGEAVVAVDAVAAEVHLEVVAAPTAMVESRFTV